MKVIKSEPPKFQPITIVIESQEELDVINACLRGAYNETISGSELEGELDNVLKVIYPEWE